MKEQTELIKLLDGTLLGGAANMLENRISIQNSFDYLRKSGEKNVIQEKTSKILQLLRKYQLFKCSWGKTSYTGATVLALE